MGPPARPPPGYSRSMHQTSRQTTSHQDVRQEVQAVGVTRAGAQLPTVHSDDRTVRNIQSHPSRSRQHAISKGPSRSSTQRGCRASDSRGTRSGNSRGWAVSSDRIEKWRHLFETFKTIEVERLRSMCASRGIETAGDSATIANRLARFLT